MPHTRSEQISTFIIVFSCLGFLLSSLWVMALGLTRDSDFLSATPASSNLARLHTFRGRLRTALWFTIIIALVSFLARDDLGLVYTAWWQCALASIVVVWLAFCVGLLLQLLIPSWILMVLALVTGVFLWLEQVFLTLPPWRSAIETPLLNFWPPAYPIQVLDHGFDPWRWIIAFAVSLMGIFFIYHHLKEWVFVRISWDHSDEYYEDFDDLTEEISADPITPQDLKCESFAYEPPKCGWIEQLLLLCLTPQQRLLGQFVGLPPLTRRWIQGLGLVSASALLLELNLTLPSAVHAMVNIAGFILMFAASCSVFPSSIIGKHFMQALPISLTLETPGSTIFPLSLASMWGLRIREHLVRSLFALPVFTVITWVLGRRLLHIEVSGWDYVVAHSLSATIWVMFWILPMFIASSSLSNNQRGVLSMTRGCFVWIFTLLIVVMLVGSSGAGLWTLVSVDTSYTLLLWCTLINLLLTAVMLFCSRKYYCSPRTDLGSLIVE
ncbi:hypothetical protein [Oceaniferula spumae]